MMAILPVVCLTTNTQPKKPSLKALFFREKQYKASALNAQMMCLDKRHLKLTKVNCQEYQGHRAAIILWHTHLISVLNHLISECNCIPQRNNMKMDSLPTEESQRKHQGYDWLRVISLSSIKFLFLIDCT